MGELERLGETYEFGSLMVRLVELRGWRLRRLAGFAGVAPGLWWLERDGAIAGPELGVSLAEVATPLFMAAMRADGIGAAA